MKVKFIGQSNPFTLTHGKEYEVVSIECGWYRIVDESGKDYLYQPHLFEITEALPEAPAAKPAPMPGDLRLARDCPPGIKYKHLTEKELSRALEVELGFCNTLSDWPETELY